MAAIWHGPCIARYQPAGGRRKKEGRMNFLMKSAWSALLLAPAIGLAMPASAFPLADPSEPGSVIVYPKWRTGTVSVDGVTLPQTEIELGAVCPVGAVCAEHQSIKVRFHWVCGGD